MCLRWRCARRVFFFSTRDRQRSWTCAWVPDLCSSNRSRRPRPRSAGEPTRTAFERARRGSRTDRKSAGKGKRVEFGGGRIIKKKKNNNITWRQQTDSTRYNILYL